MAFLFMNQKQAHINTVSVPLDRLIPHPKNYNTHNDRQIKKLRHLIKTHGYSKGSVVFQTSTHYLLAGHGILEALKAEGYTHVDAVELDVDDSKAEAFMIADNKIAEDAVIDNIALQNLISELSAMDIPSLDFGFDADDLERLASDILANSGGYQADEKDDEIPETVEPITQMGDLWTLGKHRVLCGDSTVKENVEYLLDGNKIDLIFTDPPYGVNAVGGGGKTHLGKVGGGGIVNSNWYAPIHGDENQDLAKIWWELFKDLFQHFIIFGGHCFSNFLPVSRGWLIWNKEMTGNFGDSELAWTSFDKPIKTYKFTWNGLCREGNRKDEGKNRIHPTQKPVGLIYNILTDYDFQVICDPFLGSGSSLIAAHKLNRVCMGMEIDCHYTDVVVKRYVDFVGSSEGVFVTRNGEDVGYEELSK
jgi:hypothetical protein